LNDKQDEVHMDTIICNGVEFQPEFSGGLLWKLITPIVFIAEMAKGKTLLHKPEATANYEQRHQLPDISTIVFHNKLEFYAFLNKHAVWSAQ
jgi:hypothetical protein